MTRVNLTLTFYTYFAILEHILSHYNDIEIIENIIYVPLTLLTSQTASRADSELRQLYEKICNTSGRQEEFEISFSEAKEKIINEFIKK